MSSPFARSRNSARAFRKTIGMPCVAGSSTSCSATRQPSSPGIITSSKITSGGFARAFSSPDGPSAASATCIPSASRFTRQSSRMGASSSMTRTLVMRPGFVRLYPRRGKLEREARALSFGRFDPDPAPHRGDKALSEKEAQAGPASLLIGAVELPEDSVVLSFRDPDALVRDLKLDRVALPPRGDGDTSAVRRVLDCVVDEVRQHLTQLVRVRLGGERLRRQLEHEVVTDALFCGTDDLRHERPH